MDNKKILFPENLETALIDMDGVLYDSMPYHAKAWYDMFTEFGIETDPDEFFLYEGMTGGATIQMLIQRELGRDATEEEKKRLYERKAEFFVGSGEKKMMPHADRMLNALREAGIKTVLVTGSAQESLLDSLERDYPGFFPKERMVTALDVKNGKPDPEPYLRGLQKGGSEKNRAIVVENAPLGVRAGKAAGCFTIAVTTGPIPREAFEKEGADLIFPDMKSFADWLEENLKPDLSKKLDLLVGELKPDKTLIVTDRNVDEKVLPMLQRSTLVNISPRIVLQPGEDGKNITSVAQIWEKLESIGATRKSLVINIGGGMVTDTGGFAAATFKRGIATMNLPTTLLGAVDAATGGKTGINFMGLKNEIGAFHNPKEVIISSLPLATLSKEETLSGYGEMVKTALISDRNFYISLLDLENILSNPTLLEKAMKQCVAFKEKIVERDPKETGLRKILNFGHTIGHAFESLSFKKNKPVLHGEAIAHGILGELILSHMQLGFPSEEVNFYASDFLKRNYPSLHITCEDIPSLMELMAHDKKNSRFGEPDFTLLEEIGVPIVSCRPPLKEIETALEIYIDTVG